jgi:16S rRNA (guanine527-N7)-methyltransferase
MDPVTIRELLWEEFPLDSDQWDSIQRHYELLRRWNRVLNLTRIDDVREVAERHYGESLFLASQLGDAAQLPDHGVNHGVRIVDIGSGPGFPGIPVAVARPDCRVALIEAHQRKAVFLREAVREVFGAGSPDRGNVRVLAQRAETVRERFDWAISRAVSYEDLGSTLGRLAPNAALLTGPDAPPESLGFQWNEPIRLPWGKQRFLRIGTVSHETSFT